MLLIPAFLTFLYHPPLTKPCNAFQSVIKSNVGSQEDVMSNHTASNLSKRSVVALPMQCQIMRRQNVESQETGAPRLNGFAGSISNRTHVCSTHGFSAKCQSGTHVEY